MPQSNGNINGHHYAQKQRDDPVSGLPDDVFGPEDMQSANINLRQHIGQRRGAVEAAGRRGGGRMSGHPMRGALAGRR